MPNSDIDIKRENDLDNFVRFNWITLRFPYENGRYYCWIFGGDWTMRASAHKVGNVYKHWATLFFQNIISDLDLVLTQIRQICGNRTLFLYVCHYVWPYFTYEFIKIKFVIILMLDSDTAITECLLAFVILTLIV